MFSRRFGYVLALPPFVTAGASLVPLEVTLVLLVAVLSSAAALIFGITVVRHLRRSAAIALAIAIVLSVGVTTSVALWHWPLRLAYVLSRGSFERAAADLKANRSFERRRVGFFFIRRGEITRAGVACLWVDLNPAGRTGFVNCGRNNTSFNIWSALQVDDQWQFISED
jgi:hypothetical protein